MITSRLRAAGQRVGVKVSAHRLRHTATQLLNAGCRVTSIQKLLGHRHLEHDHDLRPHPRPDGGWSTTAMDQIEQGLDLAHAEPASSHRNGRVSDDERAHTCWNSLAVGLPRSDLELRL
ncbi:MAG: site-specific integrase [Anaerolineae bacterium]